MSITKLSKKNKPLDKNKIAKNLIKLRKENNISQNTLAKITGISRQTISKWETGQNYPSLSNILKLSKYYNISLSEMYKKIL